MKLVSIEAMWVTRDVVGAAGLSRDLMHYPGISWGYSAVDRWGRYPRALTQYWTTQLVYTMRLPQTSWSVLLTLMATAYTRETVYDAG